MTLRAFGMAQQGGWGARRMPHNASHPSKARVGEARGRRSRQRAREEADRHIVQGLSWGRSRPETGSMPRCVASGDVLPAGLLEQDGGVKPWFCSVSSAAMAIW